MKKLVLILSAGNRPWISVVEKMGQNYAERCGADFVIERNLPGTEELKLPPLPDKPGRKNKLAYAAKAYLPWKYLNQGYDRVLMLDDTCCIKSDTENLFDLVPVGYTGVSKTSQSHALRSFAIIDKEVNAKRLPRLHSYNTDKYGNTGVVLYDKSALEALNPKNIIKAKRLLLLSFPHQTLFYYLMESNGAPIFKFPKQFNMMPGSNLKKEEKRNLNEIGDFFDEKVQIYHVTGSFKNREKLIRSIASAYGYM